MVKIRGKVAGAARGRTPREKRTGGGAHHTQGGGKIVGLVELKKSWNARLERYKKQVAQVLTK